MTYQSPAPILFHAEGIEAELSGHADGRCLLRVRHTRPGQPADGRLQIILQRVDQRGLARGFPVVLVDETLHFSTVLGGEPLAFVWLPRGIAFDLARGCYYRVLFSDLGA